jgi:hypothetical protein
MSYDSTQETIDHINTVRSLLSSFISILEVRKIAHDASKLASPEKEMFDEFTPKLRELTYGSPEYKQALADMGPGLKHHWENNSHHPEYYSTVESVEITSIDIYLESMAKSDAAYKWLEAYRNELESRINGMSLLDIVEMFADWKAAGMRHADGNFIDSLKHNRERFKISDQLFQVFLNTAKELGWN